MESSVASNILSRVLALILLVWLSRSYFRVLNGLRRHQQWRYQVSAIDVVPAIEEKNLIERAA